MFRKVITIRGSDSPNVQAGREVIPNILTAEEYAARRATWDEVMQCIGLDAQFWRGKDILLYPPQWLNLAAQIADMLVLKGIRRTALGIGVDTAEGGDKTAWSAVDEYGLIEQLSKQTPDTSIIPGETLAFMTRWGAAPESIFFDRGGGGYEHACVLRSKGYMVSTVAFGESIMPELRRGLKPIVEQRTHREERYVYRNRRAEMAGDLRTLLNPANHTEGVETAHGVLSKGWGIPREYTALRHQMAAIPLMYDGEGRMELPPKHRRRGEEETAKKTLTEIIGHSPDEYDSVMLAVHGLMHKVRRVVAGMR